MPGLIIDGTEIEVEGLSIRNWNDDRRLRRGSEDGRWRRTRWVRSIVCHTTKGIPGGRTYTPQNVRAGTGPDLGKEFDIARFWSGTKRQSGAHLIIDTDGSIGCLADLLLEEMFHAGNRHMNTNSVGIENYQLADGSLYESTLDACVALCDALCIHFGIQRQVHRPYLGRPVRRLQAHGNDCVGVFGHRDISTRRGPGDPGDALLCRLIDAGYEEFDFETGEDLAVWKERQSLLDVKDDGIPGPVTRHALEEAGFRHGIWTLGRCV